MTITKHGKQRIKQRVNVGKSQKKIERVARLALDRGLKHSDAKGKLKKYIDLQFLSNHTANNVRVYNNKVWIFHDETLITVKKLPSNMYKDYQYSKGAKEGLG